MISKIWPAILFTVTAIVAVNIVGYPSLVMAGLWSYGFQNFWQSLLVVVIVALFLSPWVKYVNYLCLVLLGVFAIAAIYRTELYFSWFSMGLGSGVAAKQIILPLVFAAVSIISAIGVFGRRNEILIGVIVVVLGLSPIAYSQAKIIVHESTSNKSLKDRDALKRAP